MGDIAGMGTGDLLLVLGMCVFAVLVVVVGGCVAAALTFRAIIRPEYGFFGLKKGGAFQAAPDLYGVGAFPESGTNAYQAGGDKDEDYGLSEAELKAAREYRQAMSVVDKQVDRATTAVLKGKYRPEDKISAQKILMDPEFWNGPHQAAAPGVKDE